MGQQYSIVQECQAKGFTISEDNCTITFASSVVSNFGSIGYGEFEGDPDIAGQGVVYAFLIPSLLVPIIGLIVAVSKLYSIHSSRYRRDARGILYQINRAREFLESLHTYLDDIMLAAADAQLLLILAFGISYYSTSQCEVSLYHWLIATHMILIGLATSAIAYSITRQFHKSPLTSIVRCAIFFTGAVGLKLTRGSNLIVNNNIIMHRLPGLDQKDSVILLPAYCMLEADFNPLKRLSATEQNYLIPDSLTHDTVGQLEWLITVACFVFGFTFLYYTFLWVSTSYPGRGHQMVEMKKTAKSRWASVTKLLIRASFLVICTALIIWNALSIFLLRKWIDHSPWLQRKNEVNPENLVQGIGQIAPLVALGTIVFALTNSFSEAQWGHLFKHHSNDSHEKWPTNGSYIKV